MSDQLARRPRRCGSGFLGSLRSVSVGLILHQKHRFEFALQRLPKGVRIGDCAGVCGSGIFRDRGGSALADFQSPPEGTRRRVRNAVNASAIASYFARTHITAITSDTAGRERRAKPPPSLGGWGAPVNRDYFRRPMNVAPVKAWRSRNLGYWRKRPRGRVALEVISLAQGVDYA